MFMKLTICVNFISVYEYNLWSKQNKLKHFEKMHTMDSPPYFVRVTSYICYACKMFMKLIKVANIIKLLSIIYTTSGIFPYDFD
jgi:hypothetical protein